VSRAIQFVLLFGLSAWGLAQPPPAQQQSKPVVKEEDPPEEDISLIPKEYVLNPLQAAKELTAGNYYFKKGNYKASARRFSEATKWDPGNAEAFLRLGESYEKQKDKKNARAAYAKYLELAADAKNAAAIRKKLK
jgi:predicted Zn-dependent protease